MEYSGIKIIDNLNKHINTSNFNALLTLIIIFALLKALPPALSWMVLDANISGDTKQACTGTGACWTYIKFGLKDLCMECIQMRCIGELIRHLF